MIARLKGIVDVKTQETCIVDVGGVGYELMCSLETLDWLSLGENATVQVYTHVREDQISLFGFYSEQEKEFFLRLLSVNGVGPKMAIKILSHGPFQGIARAIETGDVKALAKLPKVGKKTAEQLIVTLKGKLSVFLYNDTVLGGRVQGMGGDLPLVGPSDDSVHEGNLEIEAQITSALLNLGFRNQEIEQAFVKLRTSRTRARDLTVEEGVREVLQLFSR